MKNYICNIKISMCVTSNILTIFSILLADFRCRASYLPPSTEFKQPVRPRKGCYHGGLLLREPHGAQDLPFPW